MDPSRRTCDLCGAVVLIAVSDASNELIEIDPAPRMYGYLALHQGVAVRVGDDHRGDRFLPHVDVCPKLDPQREDIRVRELP